MQQNSNLPLIVAALVVGVVLVVLAIGIFAPEAFRPRQPPSINQSQNVTVNVQPAPVNVVVQPQPVYWQQPVQPAAEQLAPQQPAPQMLPPAYPPAEQYYQISAPADYPAPQPFQAGADGAGGRKP